VTGARVITVGAHEAAQRLRRIEGVELIRAGDPLDAVAELAAPIDADSPARAAVVIDPALVPAGEAAAFAEAARRAAPGVVILAACENGDSAAWCDGALGRVTSVEELLRAGGEPEPAAPAPDTAHTEPPPAPAPPAEPRRVEAAEIGADPEADRLEAILRGRPGLETHLAAASARLGVAAGFEIGEGGGAPVERGGTRFGRLVAPGADPADLEREAAALARWLALEAQIAQLREAAFVDDLTGSWNRGYFRRKLPRLLDAARAERRDVTLMIYDIDDFKTYNDAYGHGAGDAILRGAVRLLKSVIRPSDRVCRIGGDEFAVIFDDPRGARGATGAHPRSIGEIARRFQKQVCEARFPALGEEARTTLTISGGMATFPWDASDAESLVARADALLLESKKRGKNVITLGPGADQACRVQFPGLAGDDHPEGPGAADPNET